METTLNPQRDRATYRAPQRLLVPCPICHQTVLRGLWVTSGSDKGGHWKKLETPLTPVLGEPHICNQDKQEGH